MSFMPRKPFSVENARASICTDPSQIEVAAIRHGRAKYFCKVSISNVYYSAFTPPWEA